MDDPLRTCSYDASHRDGRHDSESIIDSCFALL